MSHALIAAGCYIGPRSNRRGNSPIATPLGKNFYLLAVDEMNWFLEQSFGPGEEISKSDNGVRRTTVEMKQVLKGRTGILVFSDLHLGAHTELWDVDKMYQADILESMFNKPKVLFWDVMVTAMA